MAVRGTARSTTSLLLIVVMSALCVAAGVLLLLRFVLPDLVLWLLVRSSAGM